MWPGSHVEPACGPSLPSFLFSGLSPMAQPGSLAAPHGGPIPTLSRTDSWARLTAYLPTFLLLRPLLFHPPSFSHFGQDQIKLDISRPSMEAPRVYNLLHLSQALPAAPPNRNPLVVDAFNRLLCGFTIDKSHFPIFVWHKKANSTSCALSFALSLSH